MTEALIETTNGFEDVRAVVPYIKLGSYRIFVLIKGRKRITRVSM